jgi:hypothetical protein
VPAGKINTTPGLSKLAITSAANRSEGVAARARILQEARGFTPLQRRAVQDVTEQFAAASRQLQPGQLVKDEAFTLFEAVGALEVGILRADQCKFDESAFSSMAITIDHFLDYGPQDGQWICASW